MISRPIRKFILAGLAAATLATLAAAQSNSLIVTTPSAPKIETQVTLWHLIKSGGWAMFPLGACSLLVVTMIVLNFQRVNSAKMLPLDIVSQLKVAALERNVELLSNLSNSTDSMFTRTLAAGLKQLNPDDPAGSRSRMEAAIAETAGREESRYGFYVNFLSLMTSMAPMWGLLGTVSGMIGAFSKIGSGGMGKPEMLAKNIGEALVCTASGLLIAITAMGFYFLFRNLLNRTMKESESHFSDILDGLLGDQVVENVVEPTGAATT